MGEKTALINMYAYTGGLVAVLGGWLWMKASVNEHMALSKLDNPTAIKIDKLPESLKRKEVNDYSQSQLLREFCDSSMIEKIGDITGEFSRVVTDNGLISADEIRTKFDPDSITIKKHGGFHYKEDSQRILVSEKNLREDLIKGLLMYFASRKDDKQYGCGFRRIMKDHSYDFGRGLTDAYRDLLYNRYFTESKDRPGDLFPDLAHLIEHLVGKDEMQRMFFESDIQGLIERLADLANLKYSNHGITMKPFKSTSIDMLEDYQSNLDRRFGFKRS